MQASPVTAKKAINRDGIARVIQLSVTLVLMAALLFGSAGTFDYPQAWAYLAFYVGMIGVMGTWMLRHDPDLINERGRVAKNVKGWDKILALFIAPLMLGILVIGGLDAVRIGWSQMPLALTLAGGLLFVASYTLVGWAMMNNAYLATFVRIQEDRGHKVATGGPYRFIRHPMYSGIIVSNIGLPFLLGSWWALIPGTLLSLLIIIRTALEDRTLQKELPGYDVYAQQVKYRLLPGVW